jgi:outer membrane biosynthesis protein TonB
MGYVKQQWQPALKGEDADTSNLFFSTAATATTTTATARVAFMITASMKEELAEKLGYEIDQVKQMTPLQASLVLHHQITPDVLEEQLPIAEQEHEELKEEEQRLRELEIKAKEKLHQEMELKMKQEQLKRQEEQQQQQQPQQEQVEQQQQQQQQQQVALDGGTSFSEQLHKRGFSGENAFGYHSSNLLLSPESDPDNEFGSLWFEVIETNHATDETSRVGLYHDEQEARIGLETRKDIADRRGRPLEFEMRPVDKNSLFS